MRRRSIVLALAVCALLVGSCETDAGSDTETTTSTGAPTTPSVVHEPVVDVVTLRAVSDRVESVARAHVEAWNGHDVDAILGFYDDETVHDDSLFGVRLQGDDLYAMPGGFVVEFADYRARVTDVFIRPDVALVFDEGFGVTLRGIDFTEHSPMLEVDRVEVDDDGTVARWSLWYDLEMWRLWGSPGFRMAVATDVLDLYEVSWATADRSAMAAMYAPGAERVDGLAGTSATGPADIAAAVSGFVGDGVVIAAGPRFSDSRKAAGEVDVVGAVFEMVQPDGCVVRTAVVLTVADGLITREEVFWDADSLVECGWAA